MTKSLKYQLENALLLKDLIKSLTPNAPADKDYIEVVAALAKKMKEEVCGDE